MPLKFERGRRKQKHFMQKMLFSLQDNQAQALDLLKALQNLKIDLEILTATRWVSYQAIVIQSSEIIT